MCTVYARYFSDHFGYFASALVAEWSKAPYALEQVRILTSANIFAFFRVYKRLRKWLESGRRNAYLKDGERRRSAW